MLILKHKRVAIDCIVPEKEERGFKMKKTKQAKEKALKPKYNAAQNTWFMLKLAWTSGEKKVIFLSIAVALSAVATSLVELYISPAVLSVLENHGTLAQLFITIAVFAGALATVSAISGYVNENTLYGRISVRLEIVNMLNRKAATTSYPNLFDDGFLKLLSKSSMCVEGNSEATEAVWTTLTTLLQNVVGFLIYIVLLSSVQPVLVLVIGVTTLISFFVGNYVNEYGYRHREEEAEYQKQLDYIIGKTRGLEAAKDIKIFGMRPWISELYKKGCASFAAFHRKAQTIYLIAGVVDILLTFLRNAAAYAYLLMLFMKNGLSVSEFLLYFSAVEGFASWVTGILNTLSTLHKQSLDISTVRECVDFKEPFKFEDGEPLKIEKDKAYEITLKNVSFLYDGAKDYTLKNINLTLKSGEKLAVVGLNGAGKSTLVKLICGFLDPTEGEVLLNGKDIRAYNRADYYRLFSAVFQDFSLIAGTVETNVAQKEEGANEARVKECIRLAGLEEKIASLKNGIKTYVNRKVYDDAAEFSGGETQRLMLARALYKNAPVVVLDEPTAALDPIAESELYLKYNEMTKGKSSVYISHRLASTRFCDRIILIDGGVIKEEGTHEELLALGGKYAELFEIQSKYYREGDGENEKL